MKITAIILAAGFSKRFEGNKLLAVYQGKPMVMHIMEKVARQTFYEMIVVSQYEEVLKLVNELTDIKCHTKCIKNSHPEVGVSESIRLGIKACNPCDAYMFFVGDAPYIEEETIQEMMKCYKTLEVKETAILCPYYKGNRGNPVIFGKDYEEELIALQGDEGGKQIIRRYPERVIQYEVKNSKELLDIDTQQDLKQLL